jgi:cell fate (sporulation/competence/biofilm development) regulator YlbF (YheA/YmcA/DUF963 family)
MNAMLYDSTSLDTTTILLQAYQIGDLIKRSQDVSNYLYWKSIMEQDPEVKKLRYQFQQKKQLFEECERFGHYHPDYHRALSEVNQIQEQFTQIEAYTQFQLAEQNLNNLFFTISQTIAKSVSDSIKVPDYQETVSIGGCSSNGGCSGKCS